MNLKKFFAAAAAVVFSTGMMFAQDLDEKMDPTHQHTELAIAQSMMKYKAHKDTDKLTDTDRAIETALNTTLPAIFNQVGNPSEELADEMETAVTALANTLLTYQDFYPANMLDEDIAKRITLQLALTYAVQKNLLSEEAINILLEGLLQDFPDEDLE